MLTAVEPGGGDMLLNAFTVDVEDYFQVSAFDSVISRDDWEQFAGRVERNTERLLELLAAHDVRGTFFILGWTADKYPQLVRRIAAAGHELACHSYWHRLIYEQSLEAFREDLRQAKAVIEDASGTRTTAFRAPSFSITSRSRWALDVLVEEGFEIDSSIFPTTHDRYGMPDAQRSIHRIETKAGSIWEFPLAVQKMGPVSLPISGGGYFRLFPFALSRRCLKGVNENGQPFSFYIHPWEIDPGQPRINGASRMSRFRHYVNLRSTEAKLERLLKSFRFGTMSEVVARQGGIAAAAESNRGESAHALTKS